MKKIAIIGGNGYIGKHLNFYLKQKGYNPMVYDIQDCDVSNYRKIDITNNKSVNEIDLDVDIIYMFAGLTGTYAGFDNYEKYLKTNELSLLNLLDAIRYSDYRPKVIFPSTRLVYKGRDNALSEDAEKETKTIYAVNKLACEGYLQAYHESFDIPYSIFRICIPYGNMLSTDYSFGTIGFFIKNAKAGKDITLYGGGSVKRTFTHMEDLCYQIVEASMKEESNGQTYNVGGETLTLRQAAVVIANKYLTKVIDVPWPERDLRIESSHTYFDDSKIQTLLGNITYKRFVDFSKDI